MTTDPITPAQLAEWRRIADAATKGPWRADEYVVCDAAGNYIANASARVAFWSPIAGRDRPNAAFIATARTAMPALLDEVERLEAQLAEATRRAGDAENENILLHRLRDAVDGWVADKGPGFAPGYDSDLVAAVVAYDAAAAAAAAARLRAELEARR